MRKRDFRLRLADDLWPVRAALNAPDDDSFLACLKSILVEGFDFNGAGCTPYEDASHLHFYAPGGEITLSCDDAAPHIASALAVFIEDYPGARIEAEPLLMSLAMSLLRQTAP
ncbi:MAG: hypothetical protein Q8J89_09310 [Caulobacter sp.]|nr:hypothetical protein [Caulobacter sp.]